jgi:hypothetical protein
LIGTLGETSSLTLHFFGDGYQVEHPEASPESTEASKDFVRCIAFGVEGHYDDPLACMSTVVQMYKNFTGGWQWINHPKIPEKVTLSTSNVSLWGTGWNERMPLLMTFSISSMCCSQSLVLLEESEKDAVRA